jgi:hypothetical protein
MQTMTSTGAPAPVKRSWADIVKGSDSSAVSTDAPSSEEEVMMVTEVSTQKMQPSQRGRRQCLCHGEILVMLGHYGWIMAFDEIDDPDASKNGGRIYVHKSDVVGGAKLKQGDVVSFYLYVDQQGLGAECCQLERRGRFAINFTSQPHADELLPCAAGSVPVDENELSGDENVVPGWNILACEFVPSGNATNFNCSAKEFVPSMNQPSYEGATTQFSADAAEFVPSVFMSIGGTTDTQFSANAAEFFPSEPRRMACTTSATEANIFSINPAFLSDDESDDDDELLADNDADISSNDGEKDSICKDSDFASEHGCEIPSDDELVVLAAPLTSKCASSDGSTSVGACSDSEPEEDALRVPGAPPGLKLPAGWRPPPGLSLDDL